MCGNVPRRPDGWLPCRLPWRGQWRSRLLFPLAGDVLGKGLDVKVQVGEPDVDGLQPRIDGGPEGVETSVHEADEPGGDQSDQREEDGQGTSGG